MADEKDSNDQRPKKVHRIELWKRVGDQRPEKVHRIGLWKRVGKSGKVYLGGSLEKYWVNIFRNDRKEKEEDPSSVIFLNQKNKEDESGPITISLWRRVGKNSGVDYAAGKRAGIRYALFANAKKTAPNQPDFHLLITEVLQDQVAETGEAKLAQPEKEAPKQTDFSNYRDHPDSPLSDEPDDKGDFLS